MGLRRGKAGVPGLRRMKELHCKVFSVQDNPPVLSSVVYVPHYAPHMSRICPALLIGRDIYGAYTEGIGDNYIFRCRYPRIIGRLAFGSLRFSTAVSPPYPYRQRKESVCVLELDLPRNGNGARIEGAFVFRTPVYLRRWCRFEPF